MGAKGLSMGVLIKQAWSLFGQNWFLVLGTLIVAAGVSFSPLILEFVISKPSPIMVALLELIKTLLTIWMFLGLLKIYLTLVKGQRPRIADLFGGLPMVLNFLVSQILLGLMMVASMALVCLVVIGPLWIYFYVQGTDFADGLALLAQFPKPYSYFYEWGTFLFVAALLFPVIWIACRFLLMPFFIVDCYEGPIEALRMAYKASKGVTWDLLMLFFVTLILLLIGFLFFGFGLFITIPIAYITQTYGYQELIETTSWKEQDAA